MPKFRKVSSCFNSSPTNDLEPILQACYPPSLASEFSPAILVIMAMHLLPLFRSTQPGPHRRKHRLFRLRPTLALILALAWSSLGCNSNPYMASVPGAIPPNGFNPNMPPGIAANPQAAAQVAELERRVRLLDDNNRQLTTQLAQSQQQVQVFRERSDLLAKQMQDLNGQLSQAKIAENQASQQVRGIQANLQRRGGAVLAANNSLARQAEPLKALGIPITIDGDLVRISVPADQIFQPGTANLNPNSATLLDPIAEGIARQFPRQRVAIEGHTDNAPAGGYATPHQLAAAQSLAILEQLTKRNNLPSNQLFQLAHGPNHPIADNNHPAGRAQNRRIDFVIYPETF